MFSWLKNHFIPHSGNDHRPHILRDYSVRCIIAFVLFFEILTFLVPILTHLNMTGGMAAVLPAVLADLTNVERQEQNLETLNVNEELNRAAEMKAEDMATLGYFAHTSPEGKTPWYWLEQAGYKYQYAGENLAINFSDSKDVTVAWMNSPTHKANIVKGNYTEVGTGVATGIYEGKETVFVAQVYANPAPTPISVPNVPVEPVAQNLPPVTPPQPETLEVPEVPPTNVLGAEVAAQAAEVPSFLKKAAASPRNTTNVILYMVFGIITLALLLYIFIKMRNHHMDLITNGLFVLALIGAISLGNHYWTNHNMVITESLDYSNLN